MNNSFKKFNLANFDEVYIYYRVSTSSQEYDYNGLDNQTHACEQYLKNNYNIKEISINYYCDIGSSYNNKSILKEQNKMLRNLSKITPSLIVVFDISRLGRNTFQVFNLLNKIKKTNSYVISIKENLCFNYNRIMDKQFYNHVINSEHNSDLKSINSLQRINNIKLKGGYLGRPPYGFEIIKENNIPKLKLCKNEMSLINSIKKKYNKDKNYLKVATYFNIKKKFKRNKMWTLNSIKSVINKDYIEHELNNLHI